MRDPDVSAWFGLRIVEPLGGGNRSQVWRGERDGETVAVRRSRRSSASLAWELDLMAQLESHLRVPLPIASDNGDLVVGDLVVQQWLAGREPNTDDDWAAVAATLQRLHEVTRGIGQRPGACTVRELVRQRRSVDADMDALPAEVEAVLSAVFASFDEAPTAVVHGDVWKPNIRIDDEGTVGLLDWDESRVDVTWHDLSPLGVRVLDDAAHVQAQQLSHAWETVNGWVVEPDYARGRYEQLLALLGE